MNKVILEGLKNQAKLEGFDTGIRYALRQLRDLYGAGLEETDLWGEYMEGEE